MRTRVSSLGKERPRAVVALIALLLAISIATGQPGAFDPPGDGTPGGPTGQWGGSGSHGGGAPDGPNIVLILADDLGWGDLGCFGNPKIRTPALDRLAELGTRFTQFYVASPVCSPTRAAAMTGRFPARARIHTGLSGDPATNEARGTADWLDPALPTVTDILRSAGYVTGHFGKWHLGGADGAPPPGAYGIDDHVTTNSVGPYFPKQNHLYFRAHSTEHIVDETIRFIEENQRRPFYVNVWPLLPHSTLSPTAAQLAEYEGMSPDGVPFLGARQIYYASVTAMDKQIGRLVDRIDELGLAENTVIIFTSDNGPANIYSRSTSHSGVGSVGPFRGKKWSLYEGGVRTPLIVRWPGHVPENAVDRTSVLSVVDFLPTFCALAGVSGAVTDIAFLGLDEYIGGVPPTSALDGEDVSDILLGSPRARGKPLMWEWRFGSNWARMIDRSPMLAIRSGRWKLLMNPDGSRVELYDIVADPAELSNVAAYRRDIVLELATAALAWQATLPQGPVHEDAGSNEYPWP